MNKEKSYELKDLVIDACEELDDNWKEIQNAGNYEDEIHEIADSFIPIYYWDIGQYASHNSWLMTEIPEINPEGNAHDQIQANIYEHIVEGLNYHVAKKEREEDDE